MAKWEVDDPGKPAAKKDAIDIMADLKRLVDDEGDVLARASLRLITDLRARAEALAADLSFVTENRDMFREAAQVERARVDAADARVAELTAKLEAPVQADAAHIRAEALREAANVDWSYGRDTTDTAPDYLTDWQRGLVSGQKSMRDAILALIPTPAPSPDVGALLMVENIDTISDLCRKHKVKEPSFRAILRALAAQEAENG